MGGGGGVVERKAQGGEHEGTAKHVPQKPPVTQARHVKPHDNASLFTVIYHSFNLKALYLQFLYQVNTIIHAEGRRPEGCIRINTDVRGVYLTYFMILFMRYRLHKGRLSQGNNWPLVFDIM